MALSKLKKLFIFTRPKETEQFILEEKNNSVDYDVRKENIQPEPEKMVSYDIDENFNYMAYRYRYPKSSDVVMRRIKVGTGKHTRRAFVVFVDGMVSGDTIDQSVIQPLLQLSYLAEKDKIEEPNDILEKLIWHSQAKTTRKVQDVIDEINFGGCGIFIDGMDVAFHLDIRGWSHRGVDKPENEQSIYGPQEAFSEMLRTNSALVRKILKDERLICEGINVGKISKTSTVILYIDGIANPKLVDEVRRRINGIDIDYVISVEEISLMIEEKTFMLTSQILSTERPDRTARALSEGRVAVIMNGSPKALILPTNSFELTHAASDAYMRLPYANMARIIRFIAMFISIMLPGIYLAATLYHQELIPTYLLYSISASRENVPFPSIVELLLMEISFEIIREASIRSPGALGSTIGIVGGLILGDAAVSARIVSPIMIIIVAMTGICSFAVTDYSLGWTYRILRFVFIILAAVGGFFAIAIGIFLYSAYLCAQKSFGVPFMSPIVQGKGGGWRGGIAVSPIWKNEKRPSFLSPISKEQEPKISQKWKKKKV